MVEATKKIFCALIVAALISCSSSTGEGASPTSMAIEHDDSHDHDHSHENDLDVSQLTDPSTVSISGSVTEIEEGDEVPEVDKGIAVEVKNGTVVGGLQRLTAEIGEQVSITLLSDEDDMFHLHVYNLEVLLSANQSKTLQFQVDIPGVFEGELHEAGYQILVLEVS